MPYYHIRIAQKGRTKDAIELNLTEKKLVGLILEKYRLRQKFACGNELVNPPDVLGMKITKSEQPLGLDHPDNFRLEYRDLWRRVEDQEDVTKKFVEFIPEPVPISQNVFIVHGRDHKPMKELKTMLYEFGLNPIVLHEKASEGSLTLAEKLEEYSKDVGYAFVILTPDDVGCQETEVEKLKSEFEAPFLKRPILVSKGYVEGLFKRFQPRARQNVIFEMGYFWGLLKRKRVCCLLKGDVEKPSDIKGIVYIRFKDSIKDVQVKIMKKLTKAKYKIEM